MQMETFTKDWSLCTCSAVACTGHRQALEGTRSHAHTPFSAPSCRAPDNPGQSRGSFFLKTLHRVGAGRRTSPEARGAWEHVPVPAATWALSDVGPRSTACPSIADSVMRRLGTVS